MKMNGKFIIIDYKGLFVYSFSHINIFGNDEKSGSQSVILVIIADKKENRRFYYCAFEIKISATDDGYF